MKDDNFFWNYNQEPGKTLKNNYIKDTGEPPLVSIITSYYNSDEFMDQTLNCVLNQTFPYWEWVVVDDGSTDSKSLEYLNGLREKDPRIHIYHKENEGLAKGRDYAIKYSNTNYILPLDADDLIEPTYIETLYWALETNPNASWAFTNSLGFGKYIYLVDHEFDSEKMKTENQITATALIRKEKIISLNGYGVAKRYVNEDWHLWLRMLARGDYPVQVCYYGFWYRRRKESLLSQINDGKAEENKLRLRDLKIEADKIIKKVKPVIYPKEKFKVSSVEKESLNENAFAKWNRTLPEEDSILFVLPDTGMDKKTYKMIKGLSENKNIIIVTLEYSEHSHYALRQQYEKFATVFNLDTFLDTKYFLQFINYIIKTRDIKEIYVSKEYESIFKDKKVSIINYTENKNRYKLEILIFKLKHTLVGRAIRKLLSKMNFFE